MRSTPRSARLRAPLWALLAGALLAGLAVAAEGPIEGAGHAPLLPSGSTVKPNPAAASSTIPTVLKAEPEQLVPGQNYTLNLTFSNLRSGVQLDFGPGISIQRPLTLIDATHAQIAVQVGAQAVPGRHLVSSTFMPPATFSVPQPLKSLGPGYVEVVAAPVSGAIMLDRLSPQQLAQGSQEVLTLFGSGFSSGMSVSFGPGISASGAVQVQSPERATVAVQVAAQAPPILRHPSVLFAGREVHVSPEATLTVTGATMPLPGPAPVTLANVPVILAVAPARLYAGQSYTLTLRGLNLVPQLQVDLGGGIVASGGLRIQSPSLATLAVTVQPGAATGMRWVGLQFGAGQPAIRQDASLLVQSAITLPVKGFAPRPGQCNPAKVPPQGTIILDGPLYTGQVSDVGGTFNVPVLNDQTTLSWHEANAGVADHYEVRFYSGSTLIATRTITAPAGYALPHAFSPDPALIAQLTSQVAARAAKVINEHPPLGTTPAISWDLTWQVAGFRTYYDSCASPAAVHSDSGMLLSVGSLGQGHEQEVEHSMPVPIAQANTGDPLLDLPAAPTGLTCGASSTPVLHLRARGSGSGSENAPQPNPGASLTLTNLTRKTLPSNVVVTADYVGDQWEFSGTLDLSSSPWAIDTQQSLNTTQPNNPIESESLNNVFVDWGDGTVEALTVQWNASYCGSHVCFASNSDTGSPSVFDLTGASNPAAFGHPYRQVGSFDVRVYALPEADVQQQGALGASLGAGSGGLYGHLLAKGLSPGAANSGSQAYMLTCQTVNIQHRTDTAANGALQLLGAHITGFPDSTGAESPPGAGATHLGINRKAAPAAAAAPAASPLPDARLVQPLPVVGVPGLGRGQGQQGQGPQFSSCDVDLVGGASLDFIGQGTVRLSWYEDGQLVGTNESPIGPSTARTDAQLAPPNPTKPIQTTWGGFKSPPLSLAQSQIGQHALAVSAEAVVNTYPIGRVMEALGTAANSGGGAAAALSGGALHGAPPLGVLGPQRAASAGLPPIAWIDQPPAGAPGVGLHLVSTLHTGGGSGIPANDPPNIATSTAAPYQITSANPALACTFKFPVNGGDFIVSGLQRGGKPTIQEQNGSYSGTGTLQASFADASGTGTQAAPVPIELKGWTMQSDGVTVAQGSFKASPPAVPLLLPGLIGSLEQVSGTAGQQVSAMLSAHLFNTEIYASNGSLPSWQHVSAPLSPSGDWYADQQMIPTLLVYDSGFSISAASATLDLSQSAGQGADPLCQGSSGAQWMGVRLNQAKLTAFNFDLANPPTVAANSWAIDSHGFCGTSSFLGGSATIDRGSIGWTGIIASAAQGSFNASYNGLNVHVPWLNVDLNSPQASTQLTAGHGAGQGGIRLNLTNPAKVTITEGPITFTANNLSFTSLATAGGWAVTSDTTFTFNAPQGQFAGGIDLQGFDYGMNGAASFADGTSARHVNLTGQKGNIGGSLVDLKSVDVQLGAPSSTTRAAFAFDSTLNLSKTLPSADVAVTYSITEPAINSYSGAGPVTAPFKLNKPFPDANPTVQLNMSPSYVGNSGASGGKSGSGVIFSSSLDLGMFGGPPVSGQFVLGYIGSDDYWIGKAMLDLGPTGIVVVPPIVNLYQIGGGLGYNVSADSFKNPDLSQATPKDDGQILFDASLLVGSPDHATFGLLGDFSIKPGGQDAGGRMDYQAWLLDPNWSGSSPITGYFSYSGGVFDGVLNAQLSYLNNQIALDALNDAIHMHIGGSQWYFHFGTQANPVNGHVFMASGQAWADLGSDGFMLGLIAKLDLDAGDCNSACAYVHDSWTLSAGITPSPLAFSASAHQNFDLGACGDGFCLNANTTAGFSMALPPPSLEFDFDLGSCPPGQISVGLQILPSVNPNIGAGACL